MNLFAGMRPQAVAHAEAEADRLCAELDEEFVTLWLRRLWLMRRTRYLRRRGRMKSFAK